MHVFRCFCCFDFVYVRREGGRVVMLVCEYDGDGGEGVRV